jgi:GNAT superfamily N-acetyltransferase
MVQRRARHQLEVTGFRLVDYEPEYREDYLRLLRGAWGEGAMTGPEFDWWFDGNPAGSLRSVAVLDGQVVGVAGHSLYRVVLDGEEAVASASVHAVTDPSARGRGIFVELERKHEREATERGLACVLAFASAPTAPLFLGPLGWTAIGKLRVWARPVSAKASGEAAPSLDLEGDAASAWQNHVMRDDTYLKWRYLDSPRGYEAVTDEGGYAVVWPAKRHKGRTIAVLADHVGDTDLLGQARRRARSRLLFALPAPEQRGAYLASGFLPTPQTLNFMGKALAGRMNTDPRSWRITLGDTDFF